MSASSPPLLAETQRWFRAVMTHPGTLEVALASPEARAILDVAAPELETVICRSAHMTAAECLGLYQRGYYLRLVECMRARYPALRHALGSGLFDDFALDYLREYPSRSYTLLALDRHFPEHLAATAPDAAEAGEPWPHFIVDLARLERHVSEVFDGAGLEGRPAGGQQFVLPTEVDDRWRAVRVEPAPSVRLLRSSYPVGHYLLAVHRGQHPVLPRPQPTFVALHRRHYEVQLFELTEASYRVLESLIAGETLQQAAQAAAVPIDAQLWEWLRGWTEAGLFAIVPVPSRASHQPRETS